MSKTILVTGGAGFIGSHLVDKLLTDKNHEVSVIDILEEQVHGSNNKPPEYFNNKAKFIHGSITDYNLLEELVKEHEVVIHLASMVGVGQSMYQIQKYVNHNVLGTANLLDILANSSHQVKKLILASSNTVYGEGKAECGNCGVVYPPLRLETQLKNKDWEVNCPICNQKVTSIPTDETTPFNISSVYALTKQNQEQLGLLIGKTYNIDTSVLRFFLVYGPRQSLSNPYTGVCSIFISKLLNGDSPIVFEDGKQTRDLVHIMDVCQAIGLALEKKGSNGEIFNVGTGNPISIKEVADIISQKVNPALRPTYTEQYRVGDIRNCVADISKIKNKLGYKPSIALKDGIEDLIEWVKPQIKNIKDNSHKAIEELNRKGLLR